jgi:putative zinc finger/helix-turn-helix YgiT family protein
MKSYCAKCNSFVDANQKITPMTLKVLDMGIDANISVLECPKCNDKIYDLENEKNNDRLIFDEYKKRKGLLTSEDILQLRKQYDLSQETLAKLLGFGKKTITRYERGSIQDVPHNLLMNLSKDPDIFYQIWTTQKQSLFPQENKKIESYFLSLNTSRVSKTDKKKRRNKNERFGY